MTIDTRRMLQGYVDCAEFADCSPDCETYGKEWSKELYARMLADCVAFINACGTTLLDALAELAPEYSDERFGHDFWLTRNGHGAGYWDRRELEPKLGHVSHALGDLAGMAGLELGVILTQRAKEAGACELYVGDDKKVYAI